MEPHLPSRAGKTGGEPAALGGWKCNFQSTPDSQIAYIMIARGLYATAYRQATESGRTEAY
ncbi:hypothetical protein [Paraburkholderia sp.]|uniref:hypothetical protein n=1 Tax=Paraburkholderia sp. TaxID=1926495 RepID=UPI0023874153|nr:hypothetical protein [Paraburkholderia sp.]MDE1178884.1 hypothetical protein [Paraburkholderia sp.]